MPSSYSPNLRIELIGAGDQEDRWGSTTNINFGTILEQAVSGVIELDITSGDHVLLVLNAALDEARNAVLICVGNPSQKRTVQVPLVNKLYELYNDTDQAVILSAGEGIEYECLPEAYARVYVSAEDQRIYGITATYAAQQILDAQDIGELILSSQTAPVDSPKFTGIPTSPTPENDNISGSIATTEFVQKNGAPPGVICIWTGSVNSIPDGWDLCDGSNGTPDLRNRFVLASDGSDIYKTGGYEDAALVSHSHSSNTSSNSATHTHTGTTNITGSHTHGNVMQWPGRYVDDDADNRAGYPGNTASAGAHTHSFTTGNQNTSHTHTISPEGVSGVGKNMPPYYALCFIMKV